nr:hypothetical protein [Winslowiella iniecta]
MVNVWVEAGCLILTTGG